MNNPHGVSREAFLKRIRTGLGRESSTPPTPPRSGSDELIRLAHGGENLTEIFTQRANAMGMQIHRANLQNFASVVQDLLTSVHAKRVALDIPDYTLADPIRNSIQNGREIIEPASEKSLGLQFDCDVGITGVVAAIAETGTLAIASDRSRSRGTFLIPSIHIAVMFTGHILPDMIDLWRMLAYRPKVLTLVSGPSKTADIEGILITGVHGPRAVHVILLDMPKS